MDISPSCDSWERLVLASCGYTSGSGKDRSGLPRSGRPPQTWSGLPRSGRPRSGRPPQPWSGLPRSGRPRNLASRARSATAKLAARPKSKAPCWAWRLQRSGPTTYWICADLVFLIFNWS